MGVGMAAYGNYPDLTSIRRILVVKLRHLGDVLLTSPVFTVLKRALPQAQIDAYIYRESLPMLDHHPAVSGFILYDREWKKLDWFDRFKHEAATLWKIRKNNYDLIINLTEGDRGAWAARLSQAKVRVGVDRRKIYTHVVKNGPSPRHNVEKQLDALRRIGLQPAREEKKLLIAISQEARESVGQKVKWEKFILIHPTSRWRFKCWSSHSFAALSQKLIDQGKCLVFTSGPDPDERAIVEEIVRSLPNESICNLAGIISLQELAVLIEQCSAMLCVDSVPFHMASALMAPVVALFGPTSEITWGPWMNPFARVVVSAMSCRPCYLDGCGGSKMCECLNAISIEKVLSELEVLSKICASRLGIIDELVDSAR
jgi:heptosyltransferase III